MMHWNDAISDHGGERVGDHQGDCEPKAQEAGAREFAPFLGVKTVNEIYLQRRHNRLHCVANEVMGR